MSDVKPSPLLGIAVGDALGMPFETLPHDSSALVGWDGKTFLDAPTSDDGYSHGLVAGQWTDDTQMSIALAQSLIECGAYDPEDAAEKYLAWFKSGTARGIGGSIRRAMENLGQGLPWDKAGIEGAIGSGTAMRAIPLGIYLPGSVVSHAAFDDACITHHSTEAIEASQVVARVAQWLAYDTLDPHLVRQMVRSYRMVVAIETGIKAQTQKEILAIGAGGSCFEIVGTALACLLTTKTYEEAVVKSIKLGGDTDTRAAIVGGWAAITRPIPPEWIEQVEAPEMLMDLDQKLTGAR